MKTIRDILKEKGGAIWSIEPDATVLEALRLMAEKNIGAVLAMQEGKIVGIFSERDYARKLVLKGRASSDTLVREIMTEKVLVVRADNSVEDCMALMTSFPCAASTRARRRAAGGAALHRRRRQGGDRRSKVRHRPAFDVHLGKPLRGTPLSVHSPRPVRLA